MPYGMVQAHRDEMPAIMARESLQAVAIASIGAHVEYDAKSIMRQWREQSGIKPTVRKAKTIAELRASLASAGIPVMEQ